MNGHIEVIKTLVDDFGVDPNSKSEVCVGVYSNMDFTCVYGSFAPCQGVLPPVLMAQFSNNWEILELLTEKYGCTIDVAVLSQVVVSIGNVYCFVIHVPYLCSKDKSRHISTKYRLDPISHITCI